MQLVVVVKRLVLAECVGASMLALMGHVGVAWVQGGGGLVVGVAGVVRQADRHMVVVLLAVQVGALLLRLNLDG